MRETTSGLQQRETTSIYAGTETAFNVRLNAGMTTGTYRPRGAARGEWADTLRHDRLLSGLGVLSEPDRTVRLWGTVLLGYDVSAGLRKRGPERLALAARWVEQNGGYCRLSYRRTFTRSLDAVSVFTSNPYDTSRLNLKLVWTLLR